MIQIFDFSDVIAVHLLILILEDIKLPSGGLYLLVLERAADLPPCLGFHGLGGPVFTYS